MWPDRQRIVQVAQWTTLGVAALGVEIAVLGALTQWCHLPLWLASAVAAELLILARFALTDRWVFGHRRPTMRRLARYHGASAGAFAVSWATLNTSAVALGVWYPVAALLGTAASFGWSLATSFLWVWAGPGRTRDLPPASR